MRNAIAVFITCNAIHATAISLPLLSGGLHSLSPKSARHLQAKFTATWIRLGRIRLKTFLSRIFISCNSKRLCNNNFRELDRNMRRTKARKKVTQISK